MSTTSVTFTFDTSEIRCRGWTDEDIEQGVLIMLNANLRSPHRSICFLNWLKREDVKIEHEEREITVFDHFDFPLEPDSEEGQRIIAAMNRYVQTGELPK